MGYKWKWCQWLTYFALTIAISPPIIDISSLLLNKNEAASSKVKSEIDQALQKFGMFVVVGHGITKDMRDAALNSSLDLFGLNLAEKQQYSINNGSRFGRGYIGFGNESGLSTYFEPKEGYSFGNPRFDSEPLNLLSIPNVWPERLGPSSIHSFNQIYNAKIKIVNTIIDALSDNFNCSSSSANSNENVKESPNLKDIASGGEDISIMRLFHYYNLQSDIVRSFVDNWPQRQENISKVHNKQLHSQHTLSPAVRPIIGSSPHTDWGFLTLIMADDIRGLQFLPKNGAPNVSDEDDWIDVPNIPGSLIVNGGDYLSLVSRGIYHSPIHRVLSPDISTAPSVGTETNSGSNIDNINSATHIKEEAGIHDRYSFVFFFYPGYNQPVSGNLLNHCFHRYYNYNKFEDNYCNNNVTAGVCSTVTNDSDTKRIQEQTLNYDVTVHDNHEVKKPMQYNTLLTLSSEHPHDDDDDSLREQDNDTLYSKSVQFGDYIIKKWLGVYRG